MSYYNSSSYLNNSTTVYTYPSTTRPSAYSGSYSNDLYRSYSNTRMAPREVTHYNQPPSFLSLRRPSSSTRNDPNTNSTKINIETINSDKNNNLNQTTTKITIVDSIDDNKKPHASRSLPIRNSSDGRSSSSSNLRIDITDNVTIDDNNNSNITTTITTTGPAPNNVAIANKTHSLNNASNASHNNNNNNNKDDNNLSISTRISPYRASNDSDLIATAVSNVQLNNTDDLMTQVDYYLNEVDNRMICSGKQVEIEGFDLQSKPTLISKCVYINKLLADANLSETNLDSDPIFTKSGKAVLLFVSQKDAENFARKHSGRFSITNVASNERALESPSRTRSPTKKNVHFIENNDVSVNVITSSDSVDDLNDYNHKPRSFQHSKSSDSILARNKLNNDNDNVVAVKKNKQEGGYEILTIRAKLKQKVGQNRSNQVTLGDIDLIMRNVVTIIQDEFMKRFPSSSDSN